MNTKRKLIALLAIATLISIVNASVFVYYPINLTISPQEPPVVFSAGSNANVDGNDLWGETITVYIKDGVDTNEGTSLTIEVHPTLQRNYYYDIAKIKNKDTNTYYIKFRVTSRTNDDNVNVAYLIINNTNTQHIIDLKSDGVQPSNWITLSSSGESGEFRVDLYIVPKSVGGTIEFKVDLIISTTEESATPPTPPGE
jgi:hypothetical protein